MKLIDLKALSSQGGMLRMLSQMAPVVEPLLGINKINAAYSAMVELYQSKVSALPEEEKSVHFYKSCLDVLGLELLLEESDLEKIPTSGPLIIVANHPFGGLEGVILGYLLKKIRPDVRIMGNFLLEHIKEMKEDLISVDPFGSGGLRNIKPIKKAIKWVGDGGALIVFPAGEVSSFNFKRMAVVDPAWSSHVAGIVRRTKASVVPIFFSGRNSTMFQGLGMIHPSLRTLMLPRELINKKNQTVRLSIGRPLIWKRLNRFESNEKMTEYLRLSAYFLHNRSDMKSPPRVKLSFRRKKPTPHVDVVKAPCQDMLVNELASLPNDALLVEQGDFAVYVVQFYEIPHIIQEIGRLREVTFRNVQEGTGNAIDLDKYDEYYLHMFLWCKSKSEIVGAYRLGQTDLILQQRGPSGLYSSTLFHYQPSFIDQLEGALEMGRSFIRQEYQRKPQTLPLLWRGIGEFLVRHPQYTILFGPVSIGQDYEEFSKGLMIEFLKNNNLDSKLSRFVKARTPVKSKLSRGDKEALTSCIKDIDDISMLISDIEKDGRGIPILLRHYLKLSGVLVSFNLDHEFSDAIDGLILVDMMLTEPKLLKRFLGSEGAELYLAYQASAKRKSKDEKCH